MRKVYVKEINYRKLLFSLLKKKSQKLFLGILTFFFLLIFINQYLLKNLKIVNIYHQALQTRRQSSFKEKNKEKIYVVQEGDDLWHIAEKFYGSGFNAYDIAQYNKLANSSSLKVGQKLILPQVTPRQLTADNVSSLSTNQVVFNQNQYIVQPGDSLSLISLKVYGDLFAWPRLLELNNLSNPDLIEVGMILKIR